MTKQEIIIIVLGNGFWPHQIINVVMWVFQDKLLQVTILPKVIYKIEQIVT